MAAEMYVTGMDRIDGEEALHWRGALHWNGGGCALSAPSPRHLVHTCAATAVHLRVLADGRRRAGGRVIWRCRERRQREEVASRGSGAVDLM